MIKVVRLRVGGNLGGNIITAEISIKLKGFFYFIFFFFLIRQFIKKNYYRIIRLYFYILKLTLISLLAL